MKKLSIAHISYGIIATGGFRHEQFLLQQLAAYYSQQADVKKETVRANRFFKGLSQLRLLVWSFAQSKADVNIVVALTALPAILRNVFSRKKILVVLHYFDERDGKGLLLKWYYMLLFRVLSGFRLRHVCVIAVAPFWVNYFEQKFIKNVPVFLFPNFFDTQQYKAFAKKDKQQQVHLGQYSFKNDPRIFTLARELSKQGITCYFSTMIPGEAGIFNGYEVRLESYETYLQNMARSAYTVAYIGINEGWNRVAHESILVGTTLIGNDAGGLGDLVRESGSLMANDIEQVISHISSQSHPPVHPAFIESYNEINAGSYLTQITRFIDQY